MNRRFLTLPVLLAGVLLAATPVDDADTALRLGNAAFRCGDYSAAINHYEKAEATTTDPAQVAFNLAAAHYFLALSTDQERSSNLSKAEELYRCCLDPADPRHLQALYGLGVCLVQAGQGREELARAGDCFDRCLALGKEPLLLAAARHNREVARIRLAQVQPTPERDPDNPPNQEQPKPQQKPEPQQQKPEPGDLAPQGGDKKAQQGSAVPVDPEQAREAKGTDQKPLPGQYPTLPPVPDKADLPPLSPRDAAEHLEQAARRILEEEKAYQTKRARPPQAGVRDW